MPLSKEQIVTGKGGETYIITLPMTNGFDIGQGEEVWRPDDWEYGSCEYEDGADAMLAVTAKGTPKAS